MAVGEILLTALLRLLLDRLARDFLSHVGKLGGVGEKLLKWSQTLSMIAGVLYDAEEKRLTSMTVELWLNDLKHLASDMEDLLDIFSTEMLAQKQQLKVDQTCTSKVRGFFTKVPHKFEFKFNLNSEIEEIAKRLQDIIDRKEGLSLKYVEHTSATTSSPSSHVLDGPVIGRAEDTKKIAQLLLRDCKPCETNFHVVAIVGLPGVGKTTLAGHVFNESAVNQFFPKVWVSVSDSFSLLRVTKAILESITSQHCAIEELSKIQDLLCKELAGKKFLIALDDVWRTCDYVSWTKLQSPFRVGAPGSKVLVTTRDGKVAVNMGASDINQFYRLENLSEEDCVRVFEQHVSNDRPPNFELLWKKVVEKCKGLPLAAKTLGGILRGVETERWEEILNDRFWSIKDGSNILPVLKLSYHYLPSNLKRCFAYCSILPNDYEFEERQLVLLWMAEGFLQQQEGSKAMEDIGSLYFGELLSRSLFQKSSTSNARYVMHDLVGDLARWAAGDMCFRLEDKVDGGCSPVTRYSSYISGKFDGIKKFEVFFKAKRLRTFLPLSVSHAHENYLTSKVTSDLLPNLKYLRVASLDGYKITKLPDSIGKLKHLRYLDLSHSLVMSLPESTSTLYNLQTLILKNCSKLKVLPSKMSNLTELRHLNNSNVPSLEQMPSQLSRLTNLQTLHNFVVAQGENLGITEIGPLLNLRGTLCLSKLENVKDVWEARNANLIGKKGIDELQLEWSSTGEKESEVLSVLEPQIMLQKLTIKGYSGFEFPKWLRDIRCPSFTNMILVKLENCKNCRVLPPLGQLPCLKEVCIKGLAGVESVGSEFKGEGSLPFPCLERLQFEDMQNWKEWIPCELDEEIQDFPCLQDLSICTCPILKGWLPKNSNSLARIVICGCEQLVVSIANHKHLHELTIDGCKRVTHRSGVAFELLEDMGLSSISEFGLEIDGFIRGLTNLEWLKITGCEGLICSNIIGGDISDTPCHFVQELRALKKLDINGCSNLISFPEVGLPPSLTQVKMESCDSLTCFARYQLPPNIRRIEIAKCQNLKVLVKEGEELDGCLEYLEIKECASFTSLSGKGGRLPRTLKSLRISDCAQLESILERFHDDTCLEDLRILKCANLKSLPEGLCHLPILHTLMIDECGSLISFPRGGLPSNITCLYIFGCDQLEALPIGMENLSSLQELWLGYSRGMSSIVEEGFPPNLVQFFFLMPESCKPLSEWGLHHLDRLTSLKELHISGVDPQLVSFPPKEVLLPQSLMKLTIGGFPNLKRLSSSFQLLTSLESLYICECPKLASVIPKQKDHLPLSLTQLRVDEGCPLLKKRYQPGKGRHWRKLAHIPYFYIGDIDGEAEADCVYKYQTIELQEVHD